MRLTLLAAKPLLLVCSTTPCFPCRGDQSGITSDLGGSSTHRGPRACVLDSDTPLLGIAPSKVLRQQV